MKNKLLIFILISFIITGCVGVGSAGLFGTGVSVALDPRTIGTQIDYSIMQKTISAKILTRDKKHIISVKTKVLDGRIFITGKVDNPEEKLIITKLANFVIINFSSGLSTFPVMKILPSKTFVFTEIICFLSLVKIFALIVFCIIE